MSVPVDSAETFTASAPPTPSTKSSRSEVESSERARQREIAAYLSAASFPPGLPTCFAAKPGLNADPILNALTQMGASRLGVDRAFVSLIDRTYQYVVSEMTKSHSLFDMKCAPGDTLGIGVCKIRNCDGVCPATMMAFMDETGEWVQTGPAVIANRTRYIINDFTTHPKYMHRPYVTAYPFFRSYLEVPLVSPLGYLLGSYCVVDSGLNDFDNDDVVKIMNEIAVSIMAHLENVRVRQSRDRSGQLIQGLSGFIRHEPATQPLPEALRDKGPPEKTEEPDLAISSPAPAASSKLDGKGDSTDTTPSEASGRRPPLNTISSSHESGHSSLSLVSTPQQDGSETPPTTPRDGPGDNPMEQQLLVALTPADASSNSGGPRAQSPSSDASEPHGFISSANIKTTFFRAAAVVRRSMDMDGLMFLDAVPSSYIDRPGQHSADSKGEPSPRDQAEGPFCGAIVKSALGPGGETVTQSTQIQLPEKSLQRFIRAYPDGHVFTADELGPIDDSYGVGKPFQSHPAADRESLRLRNDITALFRLLPNAKYVIFLPMWHFQRECWYAAALGWVEDPTRAMDVSDLSLVTAFCNSVMAEVSRLEALAASRAKSDFVSSLSHELRSPLHGIVGSSELLREAISDRSLLSILDMLDSCATTLLDTFNNLLDHAIVTHAGLDQSSPISEVRNVDLGALVEDVVEVVRVGSLSGNSDTHTSSTRRRGPYPAGHDSPDSPLLITVQVARFPWKLPLSVGAWKRIVMNIFGNAFKYTNAGRIEVALKAVKRIDRSGTASDYIAFTVEDTGLGMSSDYVKYHLFTPFSQENSHAPGMGLGLSIVQQLVNDLGGTVSVKSSLGIGTLVEVLVPLRKDSSPTNIPQPEPAKTDENVLDENFSDLKGRTVCLVLPGAYAAMAGAEFEITKEVRSWTTLVEKTLRANAGDFLGMEVVVGTKDCPDPKADVYILDCHLLNGGAKQRGDDILQTWHTRVAPFVFLCSGSATSSCLMQQTTKGRGIHLHHPIGPRKLASSLRAALEARPYGDTVQVGTDGQVNSAALTEPDFQGSQPLSGPELLAPTPPTPTLPDPAVSASTVPAPTVPAPRLPDPALPAPALPAPALPAPALPVSTEPASTVSVSTEPAPAVPAPTIPAPTIPAPTIQVPTLPAPTIPSPTIPSPTLTTPTLQVTTLPIRSEGQPAPPKAPSESTTKETDCPGTRPNDQQHLLLVDDNPVNIKVLSHLVRKLNHSFKTASHGLEAVQQYQKSLEADEKRFDVVFMDISMPIMNGFEATREIRQLEVNAAVSRSRIIALTGLSSEVNQAEATASGVDLFLTKPVKGNTIRALLGDEERAEQPPTPP